MKRILIILLIGILTITVMPAKDKFKNLQVLKFETKKELKTYMKGMAKDLGVKCKFCHDMSDKSIDTKHKKIARGMINMAANLNNEVFTWTDEIKVSCWTCHRGESEPQISRP